MRSTHIVGDAKVEYSFEGTVRFPDGSLLNAFQHDTFIARVTRPDRVNIVTFPIGERPHDSTPLRCVEATADLSDGEAIRIYGV